MEVKETMLISVTFPSRHKSESKPVDWGFSLLELMVVLVLLGGITSLALDFGAEQDA